MQTQYFFERQSISQFFIFSAGVDKIIKSFNTSQTFSSSTTWVYVRLQVPEHKLGGYSHWERWPHPIERQFWERIQQEDKKKKIWAYDRL
jgi:hypothetical protein